MKGIKFYIHPLYFALALYNIVVGNGGMFIAYFVATLLHEFSHAIIAVRLGYNMQRISMMPYGAVVTHLELLPHRPALKIAIAGPLANCAVALLVVAMWWITPDIYTLTVDFLHANVALACVNLLPCYPLDGSKILIGCVKNKLRAIKFCKIASVLVALIMIGLGIASAWHTFNASIIVMGAYLIASANMGSDKETYEHVTCNLPWTKDYARGVKKCQIYFGKDATLLQALRQLSRSKIIDFFIVDNGAVILTLTETQLRFYLEHFSLSTKFKEIAINSQNK